MFGFHTIPMGVRNKRTLFKLTKPLRSMTGEIRFTSWFNDVVCLGGKKMSVSSRGRRRKKKTFRMDFEQCMGLVFSQEREGNKQLRLIDSGHYLLGWGTHLYFTG